MNHADGQIVPFLFYAIFVVILINLLVNICLFFFSKIKNIKAVCWYWGTLLITYLFQGLFQKGDLAVTIGFSASFLPVCIVAKILFDSVKKDFPLRRYILLLAGSIFASVILAFNGMPFTIVALPVCIAINAPLVEPSILVFTRNRKTTVLQKFMAVQYLLSAVHVLNFALFRMVPGAAVYGFGTAIILYFIMSISLFAFAFDEFSKEERERLYNEVKDRTNELIESYEKLKNTSTIKDTLMNVVLHDIANPTQAQMMVIGKLEKAPHELPSMLPRLKKLNKMTANIINHVRSIELINSGKLTLNSDAVNIEQCIRDVILVFEDQIAKKNLAFNFINELEPNTSFAANSDAFTNSVMNNLISNAIKFSQEGSGLLVRAYERNEKVVIEVEDFGVGMSQELTFDVFDPLKKTTRLGTGGEIGSGYGLPLAKTYIDHFGGEIDVESRSIELFPTSHGTKFTMTLDKSGNLH